jgi:hypothetical protein
MEYRQEVFKNLSVKHTDPTTFEQQLKIMQLRNRRQEREANNRGFHTMIHYPLSMNSPRWKTCERCGEPYAEGKSATCPSGKRLTKMCLDCIHQTNGQKSKGKKVKRYITHGKN